METAKPGPKELFTRFASTISQQSLGLVDHAPEPWAQPMQCIQNVLEKVSRDGGFAVLGWAFLSRLSQWGPYLIAMHHVVWKAAGSTVALDITPFHENQIHRPFCPVSGSIAFLMDDAAQPKTIGHTIAPLASRFFPITEDPKLAAYVETLRRDDLAKCQKIYEGALASHLILQRPN
jgi:hypothetical protein